MSNRITYNRQVIGDPTGLFWFSLRDHTGHIRDWVAAKGKVEARHLFIADRPKGMLPGYSIEKGDSVA